MVPLLLNNEITKGLQERAERTLKPLELQGTGLQSRGAAPLRSDPIRILDIHQNHHCRHLVGDGTGITHRLKGRLVETSQPNNGVMA